MNQDKNKLYNLISCYLNGFVDSKKFSREFEILYYHELDDELFDEKEQFVLSNLGSLITRFTESKEDLESYPKVYIDEKTMRKLVERAWIDLKTLT